VSKRPRQVIVLYPASTPPLLSNTLIRAVVRSPNLIDSFDDHAMVFREYFVVADAALRSAMQ
jgi:hypothetical protein